MIKELLSLTRKKLDILCYLYEHRVSYLRKISQELHIHPYQTKKILDELQKKHIVTKDDEILKIHFLRLDDTWEGYAPLVYMIEVYKQDAENTILAQFIHHIKRFIHQIKWQGGDAVLTCCIFGSYARAAEGAESDIDILFVIEKEAMKTPILKQIAQLKTLFKVELSPMILLKEELWEMKEKNEPAIITLLDPKQRIIVTGIQNFFQLMGYSPFNWGL